LAVEGGALLLSAGAVGFVAGLVGDSRGVVGFADYITAGVAGVEAAGTAANSVEDSADAATVVTASDGFYSGRGRAGGAFLDAEASGEGDFNGESVWFVAAYSPGAVVVGVGEGSEIGVG
jgi:hypothetical protein